jgi:phospholipase A1
VEVAIIKGLATSRTFAMPIDRLPLACAALLFIAGHAVAGPTLQQSLLNCATYADGDQRLACFDALAAADTPAIARVSAGVTAPAVPEESSRLANEWELGPPHKHGIFSLRPHRQNYLLIANHSSSPNEAPFANFKPLAPRGQRSGLISTEVKYQLSLKTKVVEDFTPLNIDVWAAYTQQSQWQAYNRRGSSPFRDTNYQPELMAVVPLDVPILGAKLRFINVGIVHQSNGQALTLSRSWDRVYAQAGLESGNFTLLGRVWQRRKEHYRSDNNPDIIDYMGRGDVVLAYHRNGHDFSVGMRRNFTTERGAIQADWAFPLAPHLKGYVQSFSGYGQSLIDYDHKQTTVGVGLLMDY